MLLGSSHLEGLSLPDHAALVSDRELGENTAALIAQLLLPVQSLEPATRIGSLLQQLLECSRPLAAGRVRRTSALAPLRSYLQRHVSESVATGELARMSGLTVCHLIRAFHYEFGLPPHAYHLRLRLAVACERLMRGLAVANVVPVRLRRPEPPGPQDEGGLRSDPRSMGSLREGGFVKRFSPRIHRGFITEL